MNNSKRLLGGILALCISSYLSAGKPEFRQKIQKLESIKAPLYAVNTSPVLVAGVNHSDALQLKSKITEDIKNIKDDLKRIQAALISLIDTEINSLK